MLHPKFRPVRQTAVCPQLYLRASLASLLLLSALAACDSGVTTPSAEGASSFQLSQSMIELETGDSARVQASVSTQGITWASSEPTIAAVNSSGLVTGKKVGEAMLTAKYGNQRASAKVRVRRPSKQVTVSPKTDTLSAVGDTLRLQVRVVDPNGNLVSDPTVSWTSLNPDVVMVDSVGKVMAKAVGVALITAASAGAADTAALVVAQAAPPVQPSPPPVEGANPEMPRVYLDARYIAPRGRTINVPAGGDLQAALDAAAPGDQVVLQAGATYTGNFTLPAKQGTAWIVVRSSGTLPAEGTRITPADAPRLAKLVSRNSDRALDAASGAARYRLMGLEITHAPEVTEANATVSFGNSASEIIIDRSYIHGHPSLDLRRCVMLHSASSAVVDSWLSECHSKGFDSQAIISWNGRGPYKIVNNHLEGAGENIMFGGSMPDVGVIPSDIEIRRNHFFKPLAWKGVWTVKNLFEIKFAQRVLLEGNVFENNWADGQDGMAFNIKVSDEDGKCTWCVSQDLVFRNNIIRGVAGGMKVSTTKRMIIENNLFEGTGESASGRLFVLYSGLDDLRIENNTGFPRSTIIWADGAPQNRFIFRNNLVGRGNYGIKGSSYAEGNSTLRQFMPGAVVTGNVFVEASADRYPEEGNFFPQSTAEVGFQSGVGSALSSGSPFKGKGSNGKDPGVDHDQLRSLTAGVD